MIEILALIGAVSSLVVIGYMLAFVLELIDEARHKYRYKHRFDNLPTAKCYCIDSKYHDNKDGLCSSLDYLYTADSWFCYNADPREKEK